jgi:hypothetical protein
MGGDVSVTMPPSRPFRISEDARYLLGVALALALLGLLQIFIHA